MNSADYARQMRWINETYKVKKNAAMRIVEDGEQALIDIKAAEHDKICAWLATDYKISEEELAEATVILSRYFEPGTNQYDIHASMDTYTGNLTRQKMTTEELQEYQLMCALYNKCDALAGFQVGFLNGIPFLTWIADALGKYTVGSEENPYEDLVTLQVQIENSKTQHPIATWSGEISMYLLEAYAAGEMMKEKVATGTAGAVDEIVEEGSKSLLDKTPDEISNMTRKQLEDGVPDGWDFQNHNGRIHFKDENGNYRIRIDPPDKKTNYTHIHIFDENKNPLDINGNVVSPKDPSGHIPYNN